MLERSIASAYIPTADAEPRQPVEVEISGKQVGGEVAAERLVDPSGGCIRAAARTCIGRIDHRPGVIRL